MDIAKSHSDIEPDEDEPSSFGTAGAMLSVRDVAQLLGISRSFAYELCARGELTAIRIGRRLLVPRRSVWSFIAEADVAERRTVRRDHVQVHQDPVRWGE
jgi:excisionase family DNA binding protein